MVGRYLWQIFLMEILMTSRIDCYSLGLILIKIFIRVLMFLVIIVTDIRLHYLPLMILIKMK